MRFRNLLVVNPARISVRNGQLLIEQAETTRFPLEDIATVMLESRQIQISAAALESMAVSGITVFFCDEKHLPSAQLLAVNQFVRRRKLLFAQFELNKPLKKRLWQTVVRAKIQNQAKCLQLLGRDGCEELRKMADRVTSGDTGNVEGSAAAFYFKRLFGADFTRGSECAENAALNYGYAIIRGTAARNLVMHGLEPCIGIEHCSEVNNFNLADDLMEPYRPVVDLYVASHVSDCDEDGLLPSKTKRELFDLLNVLVGQNGMRFRVCGSIERLTSSLASSILNECNSLEVPELLGLEKAKDE